MQHNPPSTPSPASSLVLTQLSGRSFLTALLQTLIRPFRPRLVNPGPPLPAGSPQLQPHQSIYTSCYVNEIQVNHIYLYNVIAKPSSTTYTKLLTTAQTSSTPRHQLLYFAGGGFQSPPAKEHWKLLAELATQLSDIYTVALVSYPLAPHSPASASLPELHTLLQYFIDDANLANGTVTLVGDSAGGNVALSIALQYATKLKGQERSSSYQSLKDVLVISPPTDLRNSNPGIALADRKDPVLSAGLVESVAKAWAGDWPRDRPELSPVLADINALKQAGIRIHGVIGTYDVLAPDAIAFRKLCQQNSVKGEWLEWNGQMHCFPLAFAYGLPEGKRGKDWVIDVLKRNVF